MPKIKKLDLDPTTIQNITQSFADMENGKIYPFEQVVKELHL
jgi:hypothetical protein